MTSVRKLTPAFVNNLEYTNRVWPNKKLDSNAMIIAKCLAIIFTVGLIFIFPLIYDFSKISYNKLFDKKKPPIVVDNPKVDNPLSDPSTTTTVTTDTFDPPSVVNAPVNSTAQNLQEIAQKVLTKENAIQTLKSAFDGIKVIPQKALEYLSNPNNDRYQNIGYLMGTSLPLWIAGGLWRGSIISLLLNGSGFAITKIHERWMTPPEESEN